MKTIAVFCGSSDGAHPVYRKEAERLGETMAAQGLNLVYGGAGTGCMTSLADAVMDGGGKVTGVMPEKLIQAEKAHKKLTDLRIVKDMHERKAMMAAEADAFIALPGGSGTLEEWMEVFTWAQIGYHSKPCALLNINSYYDPLLALFDHMIDQGFAGENVKDLIVTEDNAADLIKRLIGKSVQK